MSNLRIRTGACWGAMLLAGCGGAAVPAPPNNETTQAQRVSQSAAEPSLYVTGTGGIFQYALGGTKPIHSAKSHCGSYCGPIALDRSGHLIAIENIEGAGIYDAHTLKWLRNVYPSYPTSVAVDRNDTIWIANCGGGVYAYAPGGTKQLRGIQNLYSACVIASDPSGNLYVANGYHEVDIYKPGRKPGAVTLLRTIHAGLTGPAAFAFGPRNETFIANFPYSSGGNGSVSVYATKTGKLERTIDSGIKQPGDIAVDESGTLYVASSEESWKKRDGWVSVYAPGGDKPERYIRAGINGPLALALDAGSNLYVGNVYGKLTVYSSGESKPLRRLDVSVSDSQTIVIGE